MANAQDNLAGSFKEVAETDVETRRSTLNQLVDVLQDDVSSSQTRRKYQVFVTGGLGPGVTSSLFQTVHDQDFTLQTANPIFDMTVGLFKDSPTVITPVASGGSYTGNEIDASTSLMTFASQSLMMREKVDMYRQYAANLLGDANAQFFAPFGNTDASSGIDEALFISFKRLFSRDRIKRETMAVRLFQSAAMAGNAAENGLTPEQWEAAGLTNPDTQLSEPNLDVPSTLGSAIFTDFGAASNILTTFGGEVGNVVAASNTAQTVGLIFYEHGTMVLDMKKIFWMNQHMRGTIEAVTSAGTPPGTQFMNYPGTNNNDDPGTNFQRFLVSGSMDEIIDHIAGTRFGNATQTAFTFQNVTNINSTLVFCRATADEFNYSTNPTFTDSTGRIQVIDPSQEDSQRSFTFVTTVGLYDESRNLLAVAKLSRPIEKNDEKDMTVRIRLDF